jgi:hypothetical protein
MVSATVACLPTVVSLLLLEALFMQISGVSLALTWPHRLCLFRVLLCRSLCYRLSPFQALGKVTLHPHSQACMFIYSSCGRWVIPLLLWSFPPSATLTSFPAPGCWVRAPTPTRGSLAHPACLFTVYFQSGKDSLPAIFGAQCAPPSFLCLLLSFSFFLVWRSVCPGGYAALAQACLWEYRGTRSSPGLRLPKPSGRRRLAARGPSLFLHLT